MECLDPNLVAQWLDGGAADVDEGTRRAIHDHLDACVDCRLLFAELGREIAPATATRGAEGPLLVGTRIDRYVLLEWLGEGGMGVVYAAYDPSLERRVALKLLRPTGKDVDPAGARLLAEAKALARISHPHVVTVHDAGTHEGRVFVAMEHLAGGTLASWQASGDHSVETVVGRYAEAGRGLAAAHDAGFVHRDIKPSNLMIDGEGRTKVTDFGLARAAVGPADASFGSGSWLGTPAYVSPEQRDGGAVDARSDQYAFCVALHEALHGAVPGKEATRDARVPSHVSEALARGLSVDPEQRFPDMRELLAGLRPPRAGARWTVPLLLTAVAVVLAVVVVSARIETRSSRLCSGAAARWNGIWDDSRREAVAAAFARTGAPFAADVFREAERALDEYASRWSASYTDTCEATRVRGEQSETRLDERMACLDGALGAVRVTGDLFVVADRKVVENALAEIGALPAIDSCARLDRTGAGAEIASDPRKRGALAELRGSLARARAVSAAGKYEEAERIASELAGPAASLGEQSLPSEIDFVIGRAQALRGDGATGAKTLHRALAAAEVAQDDRAKARASSQLGFVYAQRLDRPDDAEHATELARAILTRLPEEIDVRAQVHQTEAAVADARGHYDDAVLGSARAVALLEGAYGADDFRVAVALNNASSAPLHLGHPEEAKAILTRSVAILERRLGPHHPLLAISLNSLAIAELDLHQTADALAHGLRSLDIWTEATPGSSNLIQAEGVVASILSEEKRFAEALPHAERSFALVNRLAPSRSMLHAESGDTLGSLLVSLHDYDRALGIYQDVLAACAAAQCPAHVMSESLYELGVAFEAKGEPAKAIDPLRRAVAIRSETGAGPVKLAEASFVLGRVLWTSGEDRPGGRATVEQALAVFSAHPESAADAPEASAWLAGHPR